MVGKRRAGQALVEFALVSVMLFTVFCAIIEFSWVGYNVVYLNNAVSKAARVYVANDLVLKADAGELAAKTSLVTEQGGLTIYDPTVELYDDSWGVTTTRTVGGFVKVSGKISYPQITPLANFVQMAGFGTLHAASVARIE